MIDVTNKAFDFITGPRFESCNYKDVDLQEISNTVQQFPDETHNIAKILLPLLAEGFKNQKGEILVLGFGQDSQEEGTSKYKLEGMDRTKLAHAPVHNLERSVGFVNYELKRRGAK